MVSQLSITKQSRGGRVGSSETITSWLILTLHDLPGFLQSILRVAIKRNFINKYDWSFHSLANMFSIAACDVVILRKIYVVFVPFPDTDSLKPLDFLSDKSNKSERRGSPGGPVVENPLPMQETYINPWSRRIPHATQQLSPCATIAEPVHHSYWSLCA